MNLEELSNVQGRQWDDVDVSYPGTLYGIQSRCSNTLLALIEQANTFDRLNISLRVTLALSNTSVYGLI